MIGAGPDLRSLFCEALDRATRREQSEFLDQACAGRPELRARVEALLHAHREGVSFLSEPSGDAVATGAFTPSMEDAPLAATIPIERPDTIIGPYKLLEQIGEGGMGLVFVAEQQHPVRRRVALKIIRPGMDSHQVIARFEAELQALAMMDHPNIAKVLDGGTIGRVASCQLPAKTNGMPIHWQLTTGNCCNDWRCFPANSLVPLPALIRGVTDRNPWPRKDASKHPHSELPALPVCPGFARLRRVRPACTVEWPA